MLALHKVGGGWISHVRAINFGFKPLRAPKNDPHLLTSAGAFFFRKSEIGRRMELGKLPIEIYYPFFGDEYWVTSPLVVFDNPDHVVNCGRTL